MRKCKDHPTYKAKLPPRCKCEACWAMWARKRYTMRHQFFTEHGEYYAALNIDHQRFNVGDPRSLKHTEWLREQLAYALGRLLARGK